MGYKTHPNKFKVQRSYNVGPLDNNGIELETITEKELENPQIHEN